MNNKTALYLIGRQSFRVGLSVRYLEVVHQAELTAALLADGEVVAQRAGGVGAVHRVGHRVVLIASGIPDNAGAWRRRKPTHTLT